LNLERARQQLNQLKYAEAVTRVLCRRSGAMDGYVWHATGRKPPLPFWEAASEPGRCRICGQPIYAGGSFRKFAGERSKRLTWHTACTSAYFLWTKPNNYAEALILRQDGLCAITGAPIGPPAQEFVKDVDIDHEIPIYRVRRDMGARPWFELLRYWGLSNLRAITFAAHQHKSAREARERAGYRSPQGGLPLDDSLLERA
jgi:5-methylcytosine-specific restriction endonuclease McrA